MTIWFYLAVVAYALNAIAFIIDKYLLAGPSVKPFVYAFWVAILSSVVFILIPLGIFIPSSLYLFIALTSGATFFLALVFLYQAIRKTDVSIASTKVSAMSVTFAYLLSILFLGESFAVINFVAFGIIMVGILLLGKTGHSVWLEALLGGMLFGFSLVTLKMSFDLSNFINGFFWTRVGFVGTAVATLILPKMRKNIVESYRDTHSSSKLLFLLGKFFAGTGFVLLDFAIRLGNVALINALLGIQFIFIFLLALVVGLKVPKVAEDISSPILLKKFFGMALVVTGLLMLYKWF